MCLQLLNRTYSMCSEGINYTDEQNETYKILKLKRTTLLYIRAYIYIYKLNSKNSQYCLSGAIARGLIGLLLGLRDFGKFLMDPTSLLWAVSFVVIMICDTISDI